MQLYADEMDERLVPMELLKGMTEPIQAELTSYRNEHVVEYLLIRLEIGKESSLEILAIDDEVMDENVTLINENSPKK